MSCSGREKEKYTVRLGRICICVFEMVTLFSSGNSGKKFSFIINQQPILCLVLKWVGQHNLERQMIMSPCNCMERGRAGKTQETFQTRHHMQESWPKEKTKGT